MAKRKTDSKAVAIARDDENNTQTPSNGNGGTSVTTPEENNSTENSDDDLNAKLNTTLNELKAVDGLVQDGVALPKLNDTQYAAIQTKLKAFAGDVEVETWTK